MTKEQYIDRVSFLIVNTDGAFMMNKNEFGEHLDNFAKEQANRIKELEEIIKGKSECKHGIVIKVDGFKCTSCRQFFDKVPSSHKQIQ